MPGEEQAEEEEGGTAGWGKVPGLHQPVATDFGSDSLLRRVQNLSPKVSRPARSPPLRADRYITPLG